jgi:hypothetical protein
MNEHRNAIDVSVEGKCLPLKASCVTIFMRKVCCLGYSGYKNLGLQTDAVILGRLQSPDFFQWSSKLWSYF